MGTSRSRHAAGTLLALLWTYGVMGQGEESKYEIDTAVYLRLGFFGPPVTKPFRPSPPTHPHPPRY